MFLKEEVFYILNPVGSAKIETKVTRQSISCINQVPMISRISASSSLLFRVLDCKVMFLF